MAKIAFLFPGQGSQEIGMGRDLFGSDTHFTSLIRLASEITGEDLEALCLRGPDKKLMKAKYLQPLLTAVSLGYHRLVRQAGITPECVLGHSLGEITSLGASGIVSDEDAVRIAAKRGELMDAMAANVDGGMMAVLFVPMVLVEELLESMNCADRLVLANDTAADQIVLSGDSEMLDKFAAMVMEKKIGKTKKLLVSGPWHSPYMKGARVAFEEWAEPLMFQKPTVPIVLNAIARPDTHPSTIKHLVTWQLTSPVFWRESMETLKHMGIDTLLEIGPGRVLSGLARANGFGKETRVFNVNNLRGVETVIKEVA